MAYDLYKLGLHGSTDEAGSANVVTVEVWFYKLEDNDEFEGEEEKFFGGRRLDTNEWALTFVGYLVPFHYEEGGNGGHDNLRFLTFRRWLRCPHKWMTYVTGPGKVADDGMGGTVAFWADLIATEGDAIGLPVSMSGISYSHPDNNTREATLTLKQANS